MKQCHIAWLSYEGNAESTERTRMGWDITSHMQTFRAHSSGMLENPKVFHQSEDSCKKIPYFFHFLVKIYCFSLFFETVKLIFWSFWAVDWTKGHLKTYLGLWKTVFCMIKVAYMWSMMVCRVLVSQWAGPSSCTKYLNSTHSFVERCCFPQQQHMYLSRTVAHDFHYSRLQTHVSVCAVQ